MNVSTEQIRRHVGEVFGLEFSAEAVEDLAHSAPTVFHLLAWRACGRIAGGRRATDDFLRNLPEPLFNHLLVGALAFMRRGWTVDIEELLRSELYLLMSFLLLEESGKDGGIDSDDQAYAMVEKFSRLVLLEESRRAGCFAWVGRYSLSARVDDAYPPRLPIRERGISH